MTLINPSINNRSTLSAIIQSLASPIFIKDKSHKWILVNQAFCDLIGQKKEKLIGKTDYDFFPKEQADIFWEKDNHVFESRTVNINEERLTINEHNDLYLETKKIVFHDEDFGDVLCGVITDITEIKKYQNQLDLINSELTKKVKKRTIELESLNEKLKVMAYEDQLTGLMNRNAFDIKAKVAIETAKNDNSQVAFLFLDMDGLKFVNDSYGHPVGDLLIKEVGIRLKNIVPANGHLARIGGDEFLMMLPYKNISEIQLLAQTISHQMQQPAQLINKLLPLSSSLGIACFPEHGEDWISIFQNADCAMYVAKNQNKGSFKVYQHHYTTETIRKLELENELKHAIQNNEIDVYYQPIMDIDTQQLCGYEALARWHSKSFGTVSPEEFIPLAEQGSLIIELGEKVLNKAIEFISLHCTNNEYVSVNVSPVQLQNQTFTALLSELVNKHQINPAQLALEVTENVLTEVSDNLTQVSESLTLSGIKIFVDDFGTGYSNLMQLSRLKFSTIKVDREFIKNLSTSESDRSLIKAIALMANELNLTVIAEGVETDVQRQCLAELGILYGQGFYWNEAQHSNYWTNHNC